MMDNSNFNRVQAVINLDNIRDNIMAMKRLIAVSYTHLTLPTNSRV